MRSITCEHAHVLQYPLYVILTTNFEVPSLCVVARSCRHIECCCCTFYMLSWTVVQCICACSLEFWQIFTRKSSTPKFLLLARGIDPSQAVPHVRKSWGSWCVVLDSALLVYDQSLGNGFLTFEGTYVLSKRRELVTRLCAVICTEDTVL